MGYRIDVDLVGELAMRIELFQPTVEGEARVLLLIDIFSRGQQSLEGRTKLAKLDFFLRYPTYFQRALEIREAEISIDVDDSSATNIENQMVRYKYDPWDPSYYAILGRLIGKGLVQPVPEKRGIGYKATDKGKALAKQLAKEHMWQDTANKLRILKKYLNLNGSTLKEFIYKNFPEITQAKWGQTL